MSTAAPTTAVAKQDEPSALQVAKGWLEGYIMEMARALPPGLIKPDRFLRVAINAMSNKPELALCTKPSLMLAMMRSAQLGLEPDGLLGQAYVIPYRNKNLNDGRGGYEANFQIGYQGMMILAERSGLLSGPPVARVVREADQFEFWYGLEGDHFRHIPFSGPPEDAGEITHSYCIVRLKVGAPLLTVYSIGKVLQHRDRSKAADDGPWKTDFEAMVIKTMLRVGLKYAPKSVTNQAQEALQLAISRDEKAEMGAPIDLTPEEVKFVGSRRTTLEVATLGGGITAGDVMAGKATGVNDAQGGPTTSTAAPEAPLPDDCDAGRHPGLTPERLAIVPTTKSIVCGKCNADVRGTLKPPATTAEAPVTAAKSSPKSKGGQPAAAPASGAPSASTPAPAADQDALFGGSDKT
jgi:recombination protein RecT